MRSLCPLFRRLLPLHAGGDLPAWVGRRVEAHLGRCPSCREEARRYRASLSALRRLREPDPSPGVFEGLGRAVVQKIAAAESAGTAPEEEGSGRGDLLRPAVLSAVSMAFGVGLGAWVFRSATEPPPAPVAAAVKVLPAFPPRPVQEVERFFDPFGAPAVPRRRASPKGPALTPFPMEDPVELILDPVEPRDGLVRVRY